MKFLGGPLSVIPSVTQKNIPQIRLRNGEVLYSLADWC